MDGTESVRIAMLGTRGVPAQYGGFETAIEEIGRRLVERGHQVVVYRRSSQTDTTRPTTHLGMELVTLPALHSKSLETPSHTLLSVLHAITRDRFDAVFMFNAANSIYLPLLRLRRLRTAVHVDGLEWKRSKWNGLGQRFYRIAEQLSVRWADALIADARGIARYYETTFGAKTELLTYGAPIIERSADDPIDEVGLTPGRYHLVVARFEPENHVHVILDGYCRSSAEFPLVVVGSAPYSDAYTDRLRAIADDDPRVRFFGPVWDQSLLDRLYANCCLYLHGHSVGGTNPSLLRAMGAGAATAAYDVNFNREVLGNGAMFFDSPSQVRACVEDAESDPENTSRLGHRLRERASRQYKWSEVADGYEALAKRLTHGETSQGEVSGRRIRHRPDRILRSDTRLNDQ